MSLTLILCGSHRSVIEPRSTCVCFVFVVSSVRLTSHLSALIKPGDVAAASCLVCGVQWGRREDAQGYSPVWVLVDEAGSLTQWRGCYYLWGCVVSMHGDGLIGVLTVGCHRRWMYRQWRSSSTTVVVLRGRWWGSRGFLGDGGFLRTWGGMVERRRSGGDVVGGSKTVTWHRLNQGFRIRTPQAAGPPGGHIID